jgi:hypothetical protein
VFHEGVSRAGRRGRVVSPTNLKWEIFAIFDIRNNFAHRHNQDIRQKYSTHRRYFLNVLPNSLPALPEISTGYFALLGNFPYPMGCFGSLIRPILAPPNLNLTAETVEPVVRCPS